MIFNGELLRKGDGPVDMNIPVLKIDPLTDSLYALGLYNRENKIFRCSLSENDLPDEETWERTLWRGNFNIKDACPIGNGQFMTTGSAQDSDKMIFLFNPKKESFVRWTALSRTIRSASRSANPSFIPDASKNTRTKTGLCIMPGLTDAISLFSNTKMAFSKK